MIRNLKVLGLALVAMLALGATMASGAFAASFHSDTSTTTTLKGTATGDHVFDAAGSTITCTGAEFNGSQSGSTAADVTMTAKYSGCSVSILGFKISANVDMGNCAYTFFANGKVSVVDSSLGNCDSDKITYRVSNFLGECDVEVGESGNSELTGVTYTGTTTGSSITVTPNVTGIDGTATGGLCPESGAFTNGQYTSGSTSVTGTAPGGAATQIWVTH